VTAPRSPRPPAPIRPLGATRRPWSRRRKLRFARTCVIALVLVLLIWSRCSGGGGEVRTEGGTTTTAKPAATTTTVPPLTLQARVLARGLPGPHYAAAAAVVGGKAYVLGGLSKAKASTNVVWEFDPATGAARSRGALTVQSHGGAGASLGDTAFVFGGRSRAGVLDAVDSYTPPDKKAATVARLPRPRTDSVGITDPEGPTLYIVGGWDGTEPTNEVLSTIDGVTFQTVATLAEPVRWPAAVVQGTNLWVFGGEWNDIPTASIQLVDLAKGQASVVARLPQPVTRASAFVIRDTVFLAGGRVGGGRSNEIRRFDPTTYTFSPAGTLPNNLSDSSVVTIGESAYLLGGLAPMPTAQIVQITPTTSEGSKPPMTTTPATTTSRRR
jgi:hypothetical protein